MHPLPSHNSGILALEAPHHHRHAALPQHALQCATVNRDFGDNITFSTSLDIPTGGIAVISMVSQSRLFKLGHQHAASLRFINEQVYPPTKPLPPRAVPLAAAAPSCALSCCLPASLTPPPSVPSAFPSLLSFFLQNQDDQQCRAARLHGGDGCSPPAGGTPHFRQPPSPRSQGAGAAGLLPALRELGDDGGGDADRPGSVCRSSRTLSPCHTR